MLNARSLLDQLGCVSATELNDSDNEMFKVDKKTWRSARWIGILSVLSFLFDKWFDSDPYLNNPCAHHADYKLFVNQAQVRQDSDIVKEVAYLVGMFAPPTR